MLVYWDRKQTLDPRRHLTEAAAAGAIDFLIAAGEIEAGVADALCPERDSDSPVLRAMRNITIAAARSYLDNGVPPRIEMPAGLPPTVEAGIPEGYAYYALYPETYARAVKAFVEAERPGGVGVIGIRSIGTSLSGVVAVALEKAGCHVQSWTVRPRGHPFERRLTLDSALEREWREAKVDRWAVVDEGPGLSGSSMTSVAAQLADLGVADDRIVLFPSWEADGEAFVSGAARRRWQRHRKYVGGWVAPAFACGPPAVDLSGGQWRSVVFGNESEWPAANPQHERRKYLIDSRILFTFEGLGRFGKQKLERAERLWRAGFGPRPAGFDNGFIALEWVHGPRLKRSDGSDPEFIATLGRYLRFLSKEFPKKSGASDQLLREMIRVNLSIDWDMRVLEPGACAVDGRLLPQEWVRTKEGYRKTDALHHHDCHFLPGPQPIAWDVAGAMVEFGLAGDAAAALMRGCGLRISELPFWEAAYRAFRFGYCELSASAVSASAEERRFRQSAAAYAFMNDESSWRPAL